MSGYDISKISLSSTNIALIGNWKNIEPEKGFSLRTSYEAMPS